MSVWLLKSVTTKQSGSGTVAVNYPSGLQVGDTVFLLCSRGFGSSVTFTASDFQPLVSRNSQNSQALFYRVVDGTEATTSNVSASSTSPTYVMARFTGGPSAANFAASIVNTLSNGHGSSTGLNYSSLAIGANPGCLVLSGSTKQASLTSYNVPAEFTGELIHSITSDAGQSFVWDYAIQTTAADIAGGTYTITGDSSAVHQEIIAAILPAATAPPPVAGSDGRVSKPGNPALSSPLNSLQFGRLPSIPSQPQIIVPIQGLALSASLAYGAVTKSGLMNVGFIPQPGPGGGPFNNNIFLMSPAGVGNPPGNLALAGIIASASTVYIGSGPQIAQAAGVLASSSTVYGKLDGLAAGLMSGIAISASLAYGKLDGTGDMQGLAISNATVTMQGIGGSFQPLVPMTAVVDVRLGVGFQPWRVHPAGTSG